jgi:hypothetical protein
MDAVEERKILERGPALSPSLYRLRHPGSCRGGGQEIMKSVAVCRPQKQGDGAML